MSLQTFLRIDFAIFLACVRHTSGTTACSLENITCTDSRVAEGFIFKHQCPDRSEISVEGTNKTHLATADLRQQSFNHVADIVKMDNNSVITKNCQDLIITCTLSAENHVLVEEKCVNFKTSSALNTSSFQPDDRSMSPGWIAAVVLLVVSALIIGLLTCYCCWKKEKRNQQNATYFRYVVTCSCIRWVISHILPKNQEGSGFSMVGTRDIEGQHNGDIRNGGDPHGSGEPDQHTLESVTSGDMGAPNNTTPSDPSPVNGFRNMREDPGGINGTTGRALKRELDGGGVPAHHQAEEQPLLPDQRAASGGLDVAGEAVALVNELSFDQDQVSRCSAAPDTDVELTCRENPTSKI